MDTSGGGEEVTDEMSGVFETLLSTLSGWGLNVFNQKRDLAGAPVNKAAMKAHAVGSKVVMALLSPRFFDSEWCRAEVEAAAEAGVPIVPVYSGDDYTADTLLAIMKKERPHAEKGHAVKAVFQENIIDVHNPAHNAQCISDIKEKIVYRFCARPA